MSSGGVMEISKLEDLNEAEESKSVEDEAKKKKPAGKSAEDEPPVEDDDEPPFNLEDDERKISFELTDDEIRMLEQDGCEVYTEGGVVKFRRPGEWKQYLSPLEVLAYIEELDLVCTRTLEDEEEEEKRIASQGLVGLLREDLFLSDEEEEGSVSE